MSTKSNVLKTFSPPSKKRRNRLRVLIHVAPHLILNKPFECDEVYELAGDQVLITISDGNRERTRIMTFKAFLSRTAYWSRLLDEAENPIARSPEGITLRALGRAVKFMNGPNLGRTRAYRITP